MKMTEHTDGPWRTQGWVPTWAYIPVKDARHNVIASIYPDIGHNYTREEVEANARLCAAAPDLFDPWTAADDKDWAFLFSFIPDSGHGQFWKDILMKHRVAIARAEGRPAQTEADRG